MQKLATLLIVVLSTALSFGQKIKGLNFDTFHMAGTTDSRKVEFDQNDKKSKTETNLNQIPLNENDRVFIIMGNTHTAFLNEYIKRSPKYELVEMMEYLK